MSYRIEFAPKAERQLRALSSDVQARLKPRIDRLADNPRPPGVKTLRGKLKGLLRLRVGEYRVIYQVKDDVLLVLVIEIAHRKESYRK